MKAAVVHEPGSAPAYAEFADPAPENGESLVTVTAAALSQITRSRASGRHYSSSGRLPFVPGVDGVGRLSNGRRVYFVMPTAPHGGMAPRTVVPSARCIPLPDTLDDITAAAIANPGMSSWAAYRERAKLQPGETVLVNGATGTSGRLAVRIAKHLGAKRVIATGRNADTLRTLEAVGADVTILLTQHEPELVTALESHFANGIDVVIDYLWGQSAEHLLVAAAKAGADAVPIRFVQVGAISGQDLKLPSAVLRSSGIELMGSGIGSIPVDRLLTVLREVLQAVAPAGLQIDVQAFPLSDVTEVWGRDDGGPRVVFTMDD